MEIKEYKKIINDVFLNKIDNFESHTWKTEFIKETIMTHICTVCDIDIHEYIGNYLNLTCGEICIKQIIK